MSSVCWVMFTARSEISSATKTKKIQCLSCWQKWGSSPRPWRNKIQWLTNHSDLNDLLLFKKMGQPRPLFSFFSVFSNKKYNQCEKCPSSIGHRDLNPRPLEHESSHITTSLGLPPDLLLKYHSLSFIGNYSVITIYHHFVPWMFMF